MIERFDGGSSEVKNMIDIQFQQAINQDKTSKLLSYCVPSTINGYPICIDLNGPLKLLDLSPCSLHLVHDTS